MADKFNFDEDAKKFLREILARLEDDDNCDCGGCRMRRGEIDEARFKDEVAETLGAVLNTLTPDIDAFLLITALLANMDALFVLTLYVYGDGYNAGLEAGRKAQDEEQAP